MKLLYTKRSPYARKVRIVAIEKSINLELIDEDLANKSTRLKQSNPIAKVPTLINDNGQAIYDSAVIVQFLEHLQPNPSLMPKDFNHRIEALKLEALGDDLVTVAINAYMEKIRHPADFNAAFIAAQEQSINDTFAYLNHHIDLLKDYHVGTINIACAIGYIRFRLPQLILPSALSAWFDEMSKRTSFQQTIPMV